MKLNKFSSLEQYQETQVHTTSYKIPCTWTSIHDMNTLTATLRDLFPSQEMHGICHGVRNGWEVHELNQNEDMKVIGTDISPLAAEFENISVWDFHDANPEWKGRFDFIYSNALDHSYDPAACITTWIESLKPNGVCIIHWSSGHIDEDIEGADCFGASADELCTLLEKSVELAHRAPIDPTGINLLAAHCRRNNIKEVAVLAEKDQRDSIEAILNEVDLKISTLILPSALDEEILQAQFIALPSESYREMATKLRSLGLEEERNFLPLASDADGVGEFLPSARRYSFVGLKDETNSSLNLEKGANRIHLFYPRYYSELLVFRAHKH